MPTFHILVTDRRGKYASKTYAIEAETELLAYGPATERFIAENGHTPYKPGTSASRYYARFWNKVVPSPQTLETAIKLTTLEQIVLRACYATDYSDGRTPSPWSWAVTDASGLKPKSLGGIVASLVAKGMLTSNGFGTKQDDSYVSVTGAGADAALALGLIDAEFAPRNVDRPAPAPKAKAKRSTRTAPQKLAAKSARRIVRAYLRCAIEMAMLAEAGDFDEALDLRIHQLDAQLDAALEVLA